MRLLHTGPDLLRDRNGSRDSEGFAYHVSSDLTSERIFLSHDELRERMSGNLCRCGAYNGIVDAITEVYAEEAE